MASLLLANNWWAIALRGLCGVLFGIIAFVLPGAAIAALVFIFGAYALFDGAFAIVAAIRGRKELSRWGSLLVRGIVGVIAGIVAFAYPGITVIALVALVAVWAIISGIIEIVAAVRLRKVIRNEWLLGLGGALSIVFGVALWSAPIAGAVVLAWWVGAYALIFGCVQIALGFELRRWGRIEDQGVGQQPLAA